MRAYLQLNLTNEDFKERQGDPPHLHRMKHGTRILSSPKFGRVTYKEIVTVKQRYSFGNTFKSKLRSFMLERHLYLLLEQVERITLGTFNFVTSLLRILLCTPDRFLTQIIEEFQYSWVYFNLHKYVEYVCGQMVEQDLISSRSSRRHFDKVILRIFGVSQVHRSTRKKYKPVTPPISVYTLYYSAHLLVLAFVFAFTVVYNVCDINLFFGIFFALPLSNFVNFFIFLHTF